MSRLEEAIDAGRFVAHRRAPDGRTAAGSTRCASASRRIEDWVDAVNATDNTAAHAHASPLAVAIALQQLGMEPIMQLVCRDRNRLALQADIVGAALHGIENICCLTGDDVTAGDEPEARRVFDLDSIQLLATASAMRAATISPAARSTRRRTCSSARSRTRRAAVRLPRRARAQEGARRRALPAAAGRLRARAARARSCARRSRPGSPRRLRSCRRSASCARRRALRFIDEKVPGISVPADADRALRARGRPRGRVLRGRAASSPTHARSLPGVRGLHLISFRKEAGIARLCERLGIPTRRRKGVEWTQSSSRRLRPS